ncbi:MAG: hypothetical protein NZ866_02700 [Patescibacteria group bacterium]|nr:hypothetical protein [Patescibacteria group bacterium]
MKEYRRCVERLLESIRIDKSLIYIDERDGKVIIKGDLFIDYVINDEINLPKIIKEIEGDLEIEIIVEVEEDFEGTVQKFQKYEYKEVSFTAPGLERVGGDLIIPNVKTFKAENLKIVNGNLDLSSRIISREKVIDY